MTFDKDTSREIIRKAVIDFEALAAAIAAAVENQKEATPAPENPISKAKPIAIGDEVYVPAVVRYLSEGFAELTVPGFSLPVELKAERLVRKPT